jgi:hypothetical protein
MQNSNLYFTIFQKSKISNILTLARFLICLFIQSWHLCLENQNQKEFIKFFREY